MTVIGINGTTYRLDSNMLSRGGEGDIYSVRGMDYVAKIYKDGVLSPELMEKLKIMIERPPNASVMSQVAWPLDMAYDSSGQCLGFIMPKLNINAELGEIYKYPSTLTLSTQQKLNIAQNICVVISEVHKAGYVFGDFNPRNIGLDMNTGLVSFLDTDTYHVLDHSKNKIYRCNVCAPGYAAPELLDKCSDYVAENPSASKNAYALTPLPTFTKETDNFALAIHIFKLLMNGYTPYGGIIETASVSQSSPGVGDVAVRRDSYCFKPGYKHQSAAIMPLEALPQEVADLFTRAFIIGKASPGQRPSAVEWHGAITNFVQNLVSCADNPLHQYDRKNSACPLCEADKRFSAVLNGSTGANSLKQTPYSQVPISPQLLTPSPTQAVPTKPKQTTAPTPNKTSASSPAGPILVASMFLIFAFLILLLMDSFTNTPPNRASPASQIIEAATPEPEPIIQAVEYLIGDTISFGGHNWLVLDLDDNYALILTENVIGRGSYHATRRNITWGTSDIRQYLNDEFYNTFSQSDRARIRETTVTNNDNPWFGTNGDNNTNDKIFLLSIEEVVEYFGDSGALQNRLSHQIGWINDFYNNERKTSDVVGFASWWWLRSPGRNSFYAAIVSFDGWVILTGRGVGSVAGGIRPALWLRLDG